MYLLVKGENKFKLYCPDIFGVDSWGSRQQASLEKKRKYWYITYWSAGNEYIDDTEESIRLNVVLEATTLQQVLSYIIKATNNNQGIIESILVQAQEIQNERVAFENWAASRKGVKND